MVLDFAERGRCIRLDVADRSILRGSIDSDRGEPGPDIQAVDRPEAECGIGEGRERLSNRASYVSWL